MDALFHLVIAITGGFLLAEGLRMRYNRLVLISLSVLSMLPDLQHLIEYAGIKQNIELHSIFIAVIPLIIYAVLFFSKKWKEQRNYLLIFSVMLFGHLIMDTVSGINGIVLFYPLSSRSYLMPETWEVNLFGNPDKPLASTYGIGLAVYYGAIGMIAITSSLLSSRAALRKTNTRK
jgi:membrane-bound metal-dependent hydrolase YbcI (DUF457 family)